MDTRAYVWLANNLDKYIYIGEGIKIKETILSLNITSESIRNSATRQAMDEAYEKFVATFGNNILKYKTGLGNASITSKYMDCYFIEVADGIMPIGFYREIRPVETSIKVQQYIKNCQEVASETERALMENLQQRHKQIAKEIEYIGKNEKSPNKLKVFLGGLLSLVTLIFTFLVLDKLNILTAMINGSIDVSGLWLFKNAGIMSELVFIVILSMIMTVFGFVILGIIFTIRETILIKSKTNARDIAENMDTYILELQNESEESIYQCKNLYDAAGKSQQIRIDRHVTGLHINSLVKKVKNAEKFVLKTRTGRRGNDPALLYILAGCLAVMLLLNGPWKIFEPREAFDEPAVEIAYEEIIAFEDVSEEMVENETEAATGFYDGDYYVFGEHAYIVVPECKTWDDAYYAAADESGYLVCPNSEEEFDYICQIAENEGLEGFWMGASAEWTGWDDAYWDDYEDEHFTKWDYQEDVKEEDEEYLFAYKVGGMEWYYRSLENDGAIKYEEAVPDSDMGYIIELEDYGYEW